MLIFLKGASGSFSSADLSQLKDGVARVTGKVRIESLIFYHSKDLTL